jgi:CheY-like chemotaxis protein
MADSLPETRGDYQVVGLATGERSRRILIAEDNEESRQLLDTLMTQVGFETRVAANGAEAVVQFQAWQPDLIWMDLRMPVMDGHEATRRIRTLPGGDAVKIVAFTAGVLKEDRDRLIAAGCDHMLIKPIDSRLIFRTLERLLGLRLAYVNVVDASDGEVQVELGMLPRPLLDRLHKAAQRLDKAEALAVLEQVRAVSHATAEQLEGLLRAYRYDRIAVICAAEERKRH